MNDDGTNPYRAPETDITYIKPEKPRPLVVNGDVMAWVAPALDFAVHAAYPQSPGHVSMSIMVDKPEKPPSKSWIVRLVKQQSALPPQSRTSLVAPRLDASALADTARPFGAGHVATMANGDQAHFIWTQLDLEGLKPKDFSPAERKAAQDGIAQLQHQLELLQNTVEALNTTRTQKNDPYQMMAKSQSLIRKLGAISAWLEPQGKRPTPAQSEALQEMRADTLPTLLRTLANPTADRPFHGYDQQSLLMQSLTQQLTTLARLGDSLEPVLQKAAHQAAYHLACAKQQEIDPEGMFANPPKAPPPLPAPSKASGR